MTRGDEVKKQDHGPSLDLEGIKTVTGERKGESSEKSERGFQLGFPRR